MKRTASCMAAFVLMAGLAAAADEKAGNVEKGKEVFEQCGACHNTDTDEKKMGPSLKGLYKKEKMANGKPVNDANVKAVINAGGNGMPAYEDLLTDEERNDLLAYLKTL
jgi:mono/diheme cytochrome c family protein